MKKIFLLVLMLFLLQSCFGGNSSTSSGLILQDTSTFSILTPENWSAVQRSNIPVPKSGNVVLAFASNTEKQGYLNNIVVLEKQSEGKESATALMKSSLQSLEDSIENFELISEKTLTFADNQTGTILTYTGKYNNTTPNAIYLQTARICGDNNYYLTLSLTEQLASYERYEYILQTFQCKS